MIACVFRCFLVLRFAPGNIGRDMGTIRLDDIQDPEAGLAALSKDPPNETPESRKLRKFWQFQFECWRDWLAGDSLAIPRAIYCCHVVGHPPPRWLVDASVEFAERGMSPKELERQNDFARHHRRWQAVEAAKRRNHEQRVKYPRRASLSREDPYEKAVEILSRDEAEPNVLTITGSHKLIQEAGGTGATFESYRQVARRHNRRRRRRWE